MSSHKSHHIPFDLNERFSIPPRFNMICFVLMCLGLVGAILGFVLGSGEAAIHRGWANLMVNNVFFLYLGLAGAFFIATQYLANAGWSAGIKRVAEATGSYVAVGGISLILVLAIMLFGNISPIYHWAQKGIMDPANHHYDAEMAEKSPFLNIPFFFGVVALAFFVWTFFTSRFRKLSVWEDEVGTMLPFKRQRSLSAMYIVIFGITFCLFVWQVVMSVDPHWYSTIFVFYNFASMFVSGITAITLTIVLLQRAGFMHGANGNHLHDLGKLMFGLSIFWTYQWISQFLLIWYANIPEESIYYVDRIYSNIRPYFWANLLINFVLPFLVLMTRNSKRHHQTLIVAGLIILVGHWLDVYLMFEVGVMGDKLAIGIPEVLTMLGYGGLFAFVVARTLAKAPLYAKNHPYIKEFAFHEI